MSWNLGVSLQKDLELASTRQLRDSTSPGPSEEVSSDHVNSPDLHSKLRWDHTQLTLSEESDLSFPTQSLWFPPASSGSFSFLLHISQTITPVGFADKYLTTSSLIYMHIYIYAYIYAYIYMPIYTQIQAYEFSW